MPPQSDPNKPTVTDCHAASAQEQQTTIPQKDLLGVLVGGRYLIEQELGRGGIGAVFLARDKPELMSRQVVVKVLLEDSLKNEWVIQKFQQEIESLTRLDDPGVVGIFDAGKLDDGVPYLVMQYVDGVSLRAEIKPGGMDLERAANIIRQMGNTLTTAHDAGIIHRDIKPENIMLRRATSGVEQVKVIDFGIAKVKNSVIAPSTATGAGVAGTIGYMSPEQLSAQRITPASDIYALGVIAYEMLTGIRPFNPETAFQLLEMQREGARVRPKDLRPALLEAAQGMILKALAFEPGERYQRARDFSESLACALTNEPPMLEVSTLKQHEAKTVSDDKPSRPSTESVETRERQAMELAHVLFMDIVGYSRLPIDYQTKTLRQLQEIVRSTKEFARAQASNQLIRLPTGDGMALVFFGDPEAPVRCAIEVSKALKNHPDIKLRMGVHSGPVNQIVDVNESANVAGAGINMAQRVMDCGDAGHILLSKRMADDLGQYSEWQPYLHDLGETEVKHGVRMHIVNFYNNEVGNPELPEKFKKRKNRPYPILAIAALSVIAIGVVLFFWSPWNRKGTESITTNSQPKVPAPISESILTYSLVVQKMIKDPKTSEYKPLGEPFESTGQEIYGNGWKFRVSITPMRDGSLYLINEGVGANGTTVFNVLFPTRANNNRVAQLAANQTIQTGNYVFDEYKGTEKLWIVWSVVPLEKLENIFEEADKNKLVISDPKQIKTVRELLARYDSSKPEVVPNKTKKQTTIKGAGDISISLIELQHESY